jgi:hypothetical protein
MKAFCFKALLCRQTANITFAPSKHQNPKINLLKCQIANLQKGLKTHVSNFKRSYLISPPPKKILSPGMPWPQRPIKQHAWDNLFDLVKDVELSPLAEDFLINLEALPGLFENYGQAIEDTMV